MNDKKFNISTRYGVTFWEVLFLTFMVLKLTNVIAWSWLMVLSPLIVGGYIDYIGGCNNICSRQEKRNR